MPLTVKTNATDGRCVLLVDGEVDVSNAPELRAALEDSMSNAPAGVTVDLHEVGYIDSTGIGVLVGAAHRASEAGIAFAVERPQRNVARVLSMLGVDDQLGVTAQES